MFVLLVATWDVFQLPERLLLSIRYPLIKLCVCIVVGDSRIDRVTGFQPPSRASPLYIMVVSTHARCQPRAALTLTRSEPTLHLLSMISVYGHKKLQKVAVVDLIMGQL